MKKLLLTGATGTIGAPLLKRIREIYPDLVIRTANPDAPPEDSGAEWVPTDFSQPNVDYDRLVEGVDIVFHLAAKTMAVHKHHQEVNVDATRELALAAERSGTVQYFLYTSTALAHGYTTSRIIPDGQPIDPAPYYPEREIHSEYALSKYYSEKEIERVAKRVKYIIIRPVNVMPREKIDRQISGMSPMKRLWWSHRIWHPIASEDAIKPLSRFLEKEIWDALPAISHFNFTADDFNYRADHAFGAQRSPFVRGLLLKVLPVADNVKDMCKFRYMRPVWNYTSTVYDNSGLKKLGLVPERYRFESDERAG